MGRKLAGFVHVGGKVYGPDSDVPADVAKAITNPKAWGQNEDESSDKPAPAKKTAAKSSKPDA